VRWMRVRDPRVRETGTRSILASRSTSTNKNLGWGVSLEGNAFACGGDTTAVDSEQQPSAKLVPHIDVPPRTSP
jgi:hypothetical protein